MADDEEQTPISERTIGAYINQTRRRPYPVTSNIEQRLNETVATVLGPDATYKIYSGGQTRPFHYRPSSKYTSTRHNVNQAGEGRAADVEFYRNGEKITDQDTLSKIGQYWLGKGYGGVGMTMRGGGMHLDEHTGRSKYWFYGRPGSHQRSSSANIVAGARGDPGTDRPPAEIAGSPRVSPTTTSKVDRTLSDTPTLKELQTPQPQAPYDPNSKFTLRFPSVEGEPRVQMGEGPTALQQTSPTTAPTIGPLRTASMAPPSIKPAAPRLRAATESTIATAVRYIREGKDPTALAPELSQLTPAQRNNLFGMIKNAPEEQIPALVKDLETRYPQYARPAPLDPTAASAREAAAARTKGGVTRPDIGKGERTPGVNDLQPGQTTKAPSAAPTTPADDIVRQSIKGSDGKAPLIESATLGPYRVSKTKQRPLSTTEARQTVEKEIPDREPGVPRPLSPADQEAGVPNVPVRPGATPRTPSDMPGTPRSFGETPGGSYADYVRQQHADMAAGGRTPAGPVRMNPAKAAAIMAGAGAVGAGLPVDPTEQPDDELSRVAGPRAAAPAGPAQRQRFPENEMQPGEELAKRVIERSLGLPRGELDTPQGMQAVANMKAKIQNKVASDPGGTQEAVKQAARQDATAAVAARNPQIPPQGPRGGYPDYGGSPTSASDRASDLAAMSGNPGMQTLMQFFAGGGRDGE